MTQQDSTILINSINYGLRKISNLKMELDLLQIEHQGLVTLAEKLAHYKNENLPIDKIELNQDDLYFKWSDQLTRYYAAAKGVHEIFEARCEDLKRTILATASSMKEAGMEVPPELGEDIVCS